MSGLGSPLLLLIFLAGAAATSARRQLALAKATDALDARLGLGDALGGLVLLAVAGTLPELAITISRRVQGNLGLAAGNLIGGIAVQTMVLLICDIAVGPQRPLTYLVGRLTPVLEGLLVIIVVAGVEMGALLKPTTAIAGTVSPASLGIVDLLARRPLRHPPSCQGSALERDDARQPAPAAVAASARNPTSCIPTQDFSTAQVAGIFGLASLVTLGAGVALEVSGNDLANRLGVNGVIFGATVLAAATALPEISSGIAAVRLGDNSLAMGDIFGGNAFQVCLFLVADLVAGKPVLRRRGTSGRVARRARRRADGDLPASASSAARSIAGGGSARTRSWRSSSSASASPPLLRPPRVVARTWVGDPPLPTISTWNRPNGTCGC